MSWDVVRAVVDVGTTSIKLLVAEKIGWAFRTLIDEAEITKLGEGLWPKNVLSRDAMNRSAEVVADFVEAARDEGARDVAVVGTMALRSATNADEFIAKVKKLCGADTKILSGEDEARLSWLAAMSGVNRRDEQSVTAFDTGGGSTDFAFSGKKGEPLRRMSLPIGALKLTEMYFFSDVTSKDIIDEADDDIKKQLKALPQNADTMTSILVGIGGTVLTMASVQELGGMIEDGYVLTLANVTEQLEGYARLGIREKRLIPGLDPKRADVILAGSCIVRAVMETLGAESMIISTRGLRHGIMAEMMAARDSRD
ncbi:MAG: Ppx/GppA family phosphatase [Synergistaceae bacterium]|jgi:exopolyphosphatase/guanosine-5'-triphosphate,3'-diphosphate pyrophosphatase|nr:Ppx/GppA family phosphatase [Synergistaceae bacterium]